MTLAIVARRARKVAAAGGATDSFNRANSGTLGTADSGQAWSNATGGLGVTSNVAVGSGAGSNVAVLNAGISDGTFSIVVAALSGDSEGIVARADSTFANGYMFVAGNTSSVLYKKIAGSFTSIGTGSAPSNGQTLSLVLSGTSIICKIAGTTVISTTDATVPSGGTYAGLWKFNAGGSLDNFSAA